MQRTFSVSNVKTPIRDGLQNEEGILHFSLQGLLPEGHVLAFNTALGTLVYLACEGTMPRILMEQQFTTSEIYVLIPLLEAHPYYCSYEVLLASFRMGRVTELIVEQCRMRLQEVYGTEGWDQEMRPVRNVLSRARLKARALGIEISAVLETGYILMNTNKSLSAM